MHLSRQGTALTFKILGSYLIEQYLKLFFFIN